MTLITKSSTLIQDFITNTNIDIDNLLTNCNLIQPRTLNLPDHCDYFYSDFSNQYLITRYQNFQYILYQIPDAQFYMIPPESRILYGDYIFLKRDNFNSNYVCTVLEKMFRRVSV